MKTHMKHLQATLDSYSHRTNPVANINITPSAEFNVHCWYFNGRIIEVTTTRLTIEEYKKATHFKDYQRNKNLPTKSRWHVQFPTTFYTTNKLEAYLAYFLESETTEPADLYQQVIATYPEEFI